MTISRFRWVELQLAIFLDENTPFRLPEDVEAQLSQLKTEVGLPDLASVYREIYNKNTKRSSKDREYAIKAYRLALCSQRPLYAHEFAEAISFNPDGTSNRNVTRQYVLEICSNFLVTDHWTQIRFAHLSVIEFLKGETLDGLFSDELSHAQAAELCLTCFQPAAQKEACKIYESKYDVYFFSSYAGVYWPAHCSLTSEDERQTGIVSQKFKELTLNEKEKPTFIAWMDYSRGMNEIYQKRSDNETIASRALTPFLATFAEVLIQTNEIEPHEVTGKQGTALHHAVERRSRAMVSLLIDSGANIDAVNGFRETPLCWAVVLGFDDIAFLLIERGCNVHIKDEEGRTVMHFAQKSSASLVQALEKVGASLSISYADGDTLLHKAVISKNMDLISLLLEKLPIAEIATQNDQSASALLLSLRRNDLEDMDIIELFMLYVPSKNVQTLDGNETKELAILLQCLETMGRRNLQLSRQCV